MGEVSILTKEQQIILAEIAGHPLFQQFYFTGGTALSACYLHHRYSDDLDFFTEKRFDTQAILAIITDLSGIYNFTFTSEFHEVVYIFQLTFQKQRELKVDFGYYPYKRIEKDQIIYGVKTDSLVDIAVNKLLTITQRDSVKDFVDLYYLLESMSLWDLVEGVRIKFRMKLEPYIIASDFLKVEEYTYLPEMIKPLSIHELKSFFRKKAKEVGRQIVE